MSAPESFSFAPLVLSAAHEPDPQPVSNLETVKAKIETDQPISPEELEKLKTEIARLKEQTKAAMKQRDWESFNREVPPNLPEFRKYRNIESFVTDKLFLYSVGPDAVVGTNIHDLESSFFLSSLKNPEQDPPKFICQGAATLRASYNSLLVWGEGEKRASSQMLSQYSYNPDTKSFDVRNFPDESFEFFAVLPSNQLLMSKDQQLHLFVPKGDTWEHERSFSMEIPATDPRTLDQLDYLDHEEVQKFFDLKLENSCVPDKGLVTFHAVRGEYLVEFKDRSFAVKKMTEGSTSASRRLGQSADGRSIEAGTRGIYLTPGPLMRDRLLQEECIYRYQTGDTSKNVEARQLSPDRFLIIRTSSLIMMECFNGKWSIEQEFGHPPEFMEADNESMSCLVMPDGKIVVQYLRDIEGEISPLFFTTVFGERKNPFHT